MRVFNEKEEISYSDTKNFFNNRAKKYKTDNPYSVTMYQDNHPELVKERNAHETAKLLPMLRLDKDSKVLDVACGIGRWSDAITCCISEYCGIDFCDELIELAKTRNLGNNNRSFFIGASTDVQDLLSKNSKTGFNRFLFIGSLMYLNDDDVLHTLSSIEEISMEHSIICIREPIGLDSRLTLKDQFSEELVDYYNAIYRTRDQLFTLFSKTLLCRGYRITNEGFLFDEAALNNRKETAQYYFILER